MFLKFTCFNDSEIPEGVTVSNMFLVVVKYPELDDGVVDPN